MPVARVGPKHQITIPKEVFEAAKLEVGDILYATAENGRVMLTPEHLADEALLARLCAGERQTLRRARKKMKAINEDLLNSKGLTQKEVAVAVKVGLIPKDEAYSWTEEWQKDLRASDRDLRAGRVSPAFDNAEEAIAYLHQQMKKPTL